MILKYLYIPPIISLVCYFNVPPILHVFSLFILIKFESTIFYYVCLAGRSSRVETAVIISIQHFITNADPWKATKYYNNNGRTCEAEIFTKYLLYNPCLSKTNLVHFLYRIVLFFVDKLKGQLEINLSNEPFVNLVSK